VVAVLLLFIGFALFYLMKENTSDFKSANSEKTTPADSMKIKSFDSDKITNNNSSNKDNFTFKIILKKYPSEEKMKTVYDRLRSYGHKLIIIKLDSSNYELAIPFKTPLSDTLRAKDSLKEFFGGSPYVKF